MDETLIPTGGIQPLDDSPLDFRSAKPIGRDIAVQHRRYRDKFDYQIEADEELAATDLATPPCWYSPSSKTPSSMACDR